MKGFAKLVALGAVVAASSSMAFADTISTLGYANVTNNGSSGSIAFVNSANNTTNGDTGIFSSLNGDYVYYYGPLTFPSSTSVEVFAVGSTYNRAQGSNPAATYTSNSASLGTCSPNCMTVDSTGFFDIGGKDYAGTLVITTQMTTGTTLVSFSGTGTSSVTPEPNSLVLLGTGLVGAAGMLFMRRRNAAAGLF